jgi:hypothetical protein
MVILKTAAGQVDDFEAFMRSRGQSILHLRMMVMLLHCKAAEAGCSPIEASFARIQLLSQQQSYLDAVAQHLVAFKSALLDHGFVFDDASVEHPGDPGDQSSSQIRSA